MDAFYLIDFENVNNDKIKGITSLTNNDHVFIFYSEKSPAISCDIAFSKKIDVNGFHVPMGNQSLDMHLISYLGFLIGVHGKDSSYIIISNDTDYDKVIKFWQEHGYPNISRQTQIPSKKKATQPEKIQTSQPVNNTPPYKLSGSEKCLLNAHIQQGFKSLNYPAKTVGTVSSIVVSHCNDENMLQSIYDDLKSKCANYSTIYPDVTNLLKNSSFYNISDDDIINVKDSKKKTKKSEKSEIAEIQKFFNQHFRKQIYVSNKDKIISIIHKAKTKTEINTGLMKIYTDMNVVKHIYKKIQPLIDNLPGQ